MHKVLVQDLGLQQFEETWNYQEKLLQQKLQWKQTGEDNPDYLLFVEHKPVYTLGKSGKEKNLLIDKSLLREKGIEFYNINRGGDITFHGPEQIVGYPVLDLANYKTDLGWYLRSLEEVIILTLNDYGLKAERSKNETGVWLNANIKGSERKICAMGIRCSRWITMHGFALNVNTDLKYFDNIIPCGIQNKQVTSMQKELGYTIAMHHVKEKIVQHFASVFHTKMNTDYSSLNLVLLNSITRAFV